MNRLLAASMHCLLLMAPLLEAGYAFSAEEFPYFQELLLDVAPPPNFKRVPIIEFHDNGTAELDLWCSGGTVRATVTNTAMTIEVAPLTERPCPPEGLARDRELLGQLATVTAWERKGDHVTLLGPTPLKFVLATN